MMRGEEFWIWGSNQNRQMGLENTRIPRGIPVKIDIEPNIGIYKSIYDVDVGHSHIVTQLRDNQNNE